MEKKFLWVGALAVSGIFFMANSNNCTYFAGRNVQPAMDSAKTEFVLDPEFKDYWFQGKAELNVYDVQQERYGEMRPAQQVMIFVTEDFSRQKQVKLDYPAQAGADRLPVLKLNAIRRFQTGIYDYSLMTSVFSPLDGSPAVKSTVTVQDWCGHVFTQLNKAETGYIAQGFSYFESEGDSAFVLNDADYLESDFWTRIRLGPQKIQNGTYRIILSAIFSRFRHKPLKTETAEVSISDSPDNPETQNLMIQYRSTSRKLEITFEKNFPFRITAWNEWNNSKLMSAGKLRQTQRRAYWQHNRIEDRPLRDSLFLHF